MAENNVFVRPRRDAAGNAMVVLDPHTHRRLRPEGEWKSLHEVYWSRRIADGDVEVVDPPAAFADA